MTNLVEIQGNFYEYKGVTDLELIPLVNVFGTERPEKDSKEYNVWAKDFAYRYSDYSIQRILAQFLLCAFPDLPSSVVNYRVRRLPDGSEECNPGRDLRVRLSSWEFEQIIDTISPQLAKMQAEMEEKKGKTLTLVPVTVDPEEPDDDENEAALTAAKQAIAQYRINKKKGFSK